MKNEHKRARQYFCVFGEVLSRIRYSTERRNMHITRVFRALIPAYPRTSHFVGTIAAFALLFSIA